MLPPPAPMQRMSAVGTDRVEAHLGAVRHWHRELEDKRCVAAGSADVARDDPLAVELSRQQRGCDRTADGSATKREHRQLAERFRPGDASVGLHQQQLAPEAVISQTLVDVLEVVAEHRHKRGVDRSGHHTLVLTDDRGDITRDRDEAIVRHELVQALFRLPLVGRVDRRPKEAHGYGLNAVVDELGRRLVELFDVERPDDLPRVDSPFVDLTTQPSRHERRRLCLMQIIDCCSGRRSPSGAPSAGCRTRR